VGEHTLLQLHESCYTAESTPHAEKTYFSSNLGVSRVKRN
jgi:hypothetical protein